MKGIMNEGFELEIYIEELESKVAPDGGETVLPLQIPGADLPPDLRKG